MLPFRRAVPVLVPVLFALAACQGDPAGKTGTCTPRTCADAHAACGALDDGCGHALDCGTCAGGAACTANACACVPKDCAALGKTCGPADDGCGHALDCGPCEATCGICGGCGFGSPCTVAQCAGCVPKTCGELGAMCGVVGDGCGGTVNCGSCEAIDHLTSTSSLDPDHTATDAVHTDRTGCLVAPAPHAMPEVGAPVDGALALTVFGGQSSAPGEKHFTRVDLHGNGRLDVGGDATWYVDGPVTLATDDAHARDVGPLELHVAGDLTLVVNGAFRVDCATVLAAGNVHVFVVNADDTFVGCDRSNGDAVLGSDRDDATAGAKSGDLRLWTRGGVHVGTNGYLSTGDVRGAGTTSGDVEILAYGDVKIGPHDAYVIAGEATKQGGNVTLHTEGALALEADSYVIGAGHVQPPDGGGALEVLTMGGISLKERSYLLAGPGAWANVWTGGDLLLDDGSWVTAAPGSFNDGQLYVRAANVTLSNGSQLESGGMVRVEAPGFIRLSAGPNGASAIHSRQHACRSGAVDVRAEGSVTLVDGSGIYSGDATAGAGCDSGTSGDVGVHAGRAIEETGVRSDTQIFSGTGNTAGTVARESGADVEVVLDPGVESAAIAQSTPRHDLVGERLGDAGFLARMPIGYAGALLRVAPDGGDFHTFRHVGQLQDGWKWQVLLAPRSFDPTAIDGVGFRAAPHE